MRNAIDRHVLEYGVIQRCLQGLASRCQMNVCLDSRAVSVVSATARTAIYGMKRVRSDPRIDVANPTAERAIDHRP